MSVLLAVLSIFSITLVHFIRSFILYRNREFDRASALKGNCRYFAVQMAADHGRQDLAYSISRYRER